MNQKKKKKKKKKKKNANPTKHTNMTHTHTHTHASKHVPITLHPSPTVSRLGECVRGLDERQQCEDEGGVQRDV